MSNISVKVTLALFLALAMPAASFARGAGAAATGHLGAGRANAAELGALESMSVDPSGVGNASRVAPIPPPRITIPVIPQFKWLRTGLDLLLDIRRDTDLDRLAADVAADVAAIEAAAPMRLVYCFPISSSAARTAILLAAMPSGFFGILFAVNYQLDSATAGSMVTVSTCFSIVTLAIAIAVLFPQ